MDGGIESTGSAVKSRILLAIVPPILVVDWITKAWALSERGGVPGPIGEMLGGLMPLTLAYNKGAAFGLSVGEDSRWFFIPVTFLALGLIAMLYRQAESDDRLRLVSLALVVAGALGNLWDRVRWDRGVVDFLGPVDLVVYDFPIFNVADIAISIGAVLLAISFWQEEKRLAREAAVETASNDDPALSSDRAAP
ncbi:MAG TPA: signal peptidase II [Longimicrobiales bacterium]|nr:signal peptidase II [Longimicrobiales bacterium]